MKCPKCSVTLLMTERTGVMIDYCPECRGIWLEAGKLDLIVNNVSGVSSQGRTDTHPYRPDDHDDHDDDGHGFGHRRRRKSFLGDLFD
jgi:uncharacterized protein